MKIVLDTDTKRAICPPVFFDNIRKINDASELTGRKEGISPEEYLDKIINDCKNVIISKKEVAKTGRTTKAKLTLGELTINPSK